MIVCGSVVTGSATVRVSSAQEEVFLTLDANVLSDSSRSQLPVNESLTIVSSRSPLLSSQETGLDTDILMILHQPRVVVSLASQASRGGVHTISGINKNLSSVDVTLQADIRVQEP